MPRVISKLRSLAPGARIVFAVPPRAMRWLPFGESEVDEILPVEGGGLDPRRALRLLRALRERDVESVALVYDGHSPFGYLKIEALALLLGKPEVLVFVRDRGPRRRSRWWLLGRVALGAAYLALNVLISLVYVALTAAIIGIFDLVTVPIVLAKRGRASGG